MLVILTHVRIFHRVWHVQKCQSLTFSTVCQQSFKFCLKFFHTRNTLLVTWLYSTYVVSDKWWLKLVNLTFDICVFSFSFYKTSKLRPSNAGPRGMAAFSPAWRKLGVHKIVFTGYNFFQGGQIFLTYPYFNWPGCYRAIQMRCDLPSGRLGIAVPHYRSICPPMKIKQLFVLLRDSLLWLLLCRHVLSGVIYN